MQAVVSRQPARGFRRLNLLLQAPGWAQEGCVRSRFCVEALKAGRASQLSCVAP